MYIDTNYLDRLLTGNEIEAIIKFLHEGKLGVGWIQD